MNIPLVQAVSPAANTLGGQGWRQAGELEFALLLSGAIGWSGRSARRTPACGLIFVRRDAVRGLTTAAATGAKSRRTHTGRADSGRAAGIPCGPRGRGRWFLWCVRPVAGRVAVTILQDGWCGVGPGRALAFRPARVVVLPENRFGGGPAWIPAARPAGMIGVQGVRPGWPGPAGILILGLGRPGGRRGQVRRAEPRIASAPVTAGVRKPVQRDRVSDSVGGTVGPGPGCLGVHAAPPAAGPAASDPAAAVADR